MAVKQKGDGVGIDEAKRVQALKDVAQRAEGRGERVLSLKRIYFLLGVLGVAALFWASGAVLMAGGLHSRGKVKDGLVAEKINVADPKILLTYPDARAPEGVEVPKVLVDDSDEAFLEAQVIRTHLMKSTEGKTWTELPSQIDDPANPGKKIANPLRNTYIQGVTLQSALHQAHIGFEITALVIGIGAVFATFGTAIALLGLPAAFVLTRSRT